MEVYFDNSATTRCYDEVCDLMMKAMKEDYGNPSAMHQKGVDAELYVRKAAKTIAKTLKASEKEILFTSGGTESDNLALIGGAMAARRSGNHIITTAVEHPAVANPVQYLEKQGFEVTVLPVDDTGVILLPELLKALREDTILVSVMHVNNEVGSVMPLQAIGELVHQKSPKALFHVDAIQGYGKLPIVPKSAGIDLMSVSSHKIHGPKGVGFLYIRKGAKVQPLILGGGQQEGMRSGTDNVPGIVGMALAAERVTEHLEEYSEHMYQLKERMARGLSEFENVIINGPELRKAAPQIMSVSFPGIRSEVLLHSLEEKGIYVSAGSACSSHKRKPSQTLTSMGLPKEQLESTVRISFSEQNTFEEVDYCLGVLETLLPMLRRYARH